MEVSYSEKSTQPAERRTEVSQCTKSLDYYSAVHPCVSTAAVGKPGRGTLQCLALFFQEGVLFPPDISFFYSTCLLAQFLPFPPLVCCFVSSFGEVDKLGNLGQ